MLLPADVARAGEQQRAVADLHRPVRSQIYPLVELGIDTLFEHGRAAGLHQVERRETSVRQRLFHEIGRLVTGPEILRQYTELCGGRVVDKQKLTLFILYGHCRRQHADDFAERRKFGSENVMRRYAHPGQRQIGWAVGVFRRKRRIGGGCILHGCGTSQNAL